MSLEQFSKQYPEAYEQMCEEMFDKAYNFCIEENVPKEVAEIRTRIRYQRSAVRRVVTV